MLRSLLRAATFAGLMTMLGCASGPASTNPTSLSPVFSSNVPASGPTPWTSAQFNRSETDFSFVVIGDRTGGARPGVFERGIRQAELLEPEFILSVGDLIEGYTEDPKQIDAQWAELDGILKGLRAPFFHVVGNHDMGNDAMVRAWADRFGPKSYYHFRYKDVLFLALNTEDPPTPLPPEMLASMPAFLQMIAANPQAAEKMVLDYYAAAASGQGPAAPELPATISDAQVEAMKLALEQNKDVRWTFVVMHKPAWTLGSENFARIEALLQDRPYTVLAGHNHYFKHEVRNGRDYIQMGSTGGIGHKPGPGMVDHVTLVTMKASGPVFANIKLTGLFELDGAAGHPNAR